MQTPNPCAVLRRKAPEERPANSESFREQAGDGRRRSGVPTTWRRFERTFVAHGRFDRVGQRTEGRKLTKRRNGVGCGMADNVLRTRDSASNVRQNTY
jgi:hypothetical protein